MSSERRDTRIRSILHEGRSRYAGEKYGIEIELERIAATDEEDERGDYPRVSFGHWMTKGDGSLRAGVELVSDPLGAHQVAAALEDAYGWAQRNSYAPSVRCGLHVHVNMGGRSLAFLSKALAAYALAEPYLFSFVGQEREQSIYCVPWYLDIRQYNAVKTVLKDMEEPNFRSRDSDAWDVLCKYSALNLLPLFAYHTVEFRHAPVFPAQGQALQWVRLIRDIINRSGWLALHSDKVSALRSIVSPYLTTAEMQSGEETTERYSVVERYETMIQPCTYKAGSWGLPAVLEALDAGKQIRPIVTVNRNAPPVPDMVWRRMDETPPPEPVRTMNVAPNVVLDDWTGPDVEDFVP